jgi:hypothetical protein
VDATTAGAHSDGRRSTLLPTPRYLLRVVQSEPAAGTAPVSEAPTVARSPPEADARTVVRLDSSPRERGNQPRLQNRAPTATPGCEHRMPGRVPVLHSRTSLHRFQAWVYVSRSQSLVSRPPSPGPATQRRAAPRIRYFVIAERRYCSGCRRLESGRDTSRPLPACIRGIRSARSRSSLPPSSVMPNDRSHVTGDASTSVCDRLDAERRRAAARRPVRRSVRWLRVVHSQG